MFTIKDMGELISSNYKLSKFNCYTEYNNSTLIFNSLKNSFSKIKQLDFQNIPINSFSNMELKFFIKQGIIVENSCDEDELASEKLYKFANNKYLLFTILPTLDCQFRCAYCYEEKKHEVISDDVLNSLFLYIKNNIKGKNEIDISWFGGEPLLTQSKVFDFSKRVKELCKENKLKFSSGMTTNAYVLNLNTFKKCLDCGINHFQITIDGTKDIHDSLRFLKNHGGTFDQIISNLTSIRDYYVDKRNVKFSISIRINFVKESLEKFEEIIDFYDNLFGKDKRFYLFLKTVGDYGGDEVKKIDDKIVQATDFPYIPLENKKIGITKYISINNTLNLCYAAHNNSLVVMPNGSIKKCTVSFDDKVNCVGKLNNKGEIIFNSDISKWDFSTFKLKIQRCRDCPLYANCYSLLCPLHPINRAKTCSNIEKYKVDLIEIYKSNSKLFLHYGDKNEKQESH